MIEIRETEVYKKWFDSIKDKKTKSIIDVRIRKVSLDNFGHVEPVRKGVSELKIDYDAGLRVYFLNQECRVRWQRTLLISLKELRSNQMKSLQPYGMHQNILKPQRIW